MSAPVDVLAVLDEAASWLPCDGEDDRIRERFADVRDAVVELIQAVWQYHGPADDPNIGWCGISPSHPDLFKCERCGVEHKDTSLLPHRSNCAAVRLMKALARVGGQP